MYYVEKKMIISAAHNLKLDYESKCNQIHGHNWVFTIYCKAKELNENGMVVDFACIKKLVDEKLDHKYINDVLPFNPTAENLAHWVVETVPHCYRCDVEETPNNKATYVKDED